METSLDNNLVGQLINAAKVINCDEERKLAIEQCVEEKEKLKEKKSQLKEQADKITKSDRPKGALVWGIIITAFGAITLLMMLTMLSAPEAPNPATLFVVILPCFIIGISLILKHKKLIEEHESKIVLANDEVSKFEKYTLIPKTKELDEKINEIQKERNTLIPLREEFLNFIPMQYRTKEAIAYILMVVSNKRADTLKEAMNLYEDYKVQMMMLDFMQKNQEEQRLANATLACIDQNIELVDKRLKTISTIQTIDFIFRHI